MTPRAAFWKFKLRPEVIFIKNRKHKKKAEKIIPRRSEQNTRDQHPLFASLILLCGIFGLLLYFGSLPGVYFEKAPAFAAAAVWCAAFAFLFYRDRKYFYIVSACAAALVLLTAVFGRELLSAQLDYLSGALTGAPAAEPPSVTLLVLAALPLIAAALPPLESAVGGSFPLAAALLTIAAPLLGAEKSMPALLLIAVSAVGSRALSANGGGRAKAAALCCAVLAALIAVSSAFVYPCADRLSGLTNAAEGRIFRFIAEKTGRSTDPVQGGKVSRFNNYLTDREQLIVQVTRYPKEPIYLKGFVGGEYNKGEWEAADDTSILNDIQNKYQNSWGVLGITNTYSSLYFTMNLNTLDDTIPYPASMSVRYVSSEGKNYYVPYYSRVDTIYVYGGYRFQYYEKDDMRIDWNNVPRMYERKRDQCLNLQAAYSAEAKDVYTRVPENRLPRLHALCADKDFESLAEITDFIKSTLNERTEYTQTPGWSTPGGDPVEEFLFDRGRGYCVHYASAAALMYRMLGVPARYVTGYMIEPADFERQKYGTYNAALKDKNAHAWVEIFLRNYGWTPVDMTPQAGGGTAAEIYPGYSEPEKIEESGGTGLNINLIPKNRGEDEPDIQETAESGEAAEPEDRTADYAMFERMEKPIRTAVKIILPSALLAAAIFLALRKKRRLKRAGCRGEFARLIDALGAAGIMRGYDGTEPDFCEKLTAALPEADPSALRRAVGTVMTAAYGKNPPNGDDSGFAEKTCRSAAAIIRKKMPIYKRIIFTIKNIF